MVAKMCYKDVLLISEKPNQLHIHMYLKFKRKFKLREKASHLQCLIELSKNLFTR